MTAPADAVLAQARAVAAEVLGNEEHTAGIEHSALRVGSVERLAAVTRLTGVVEAPGDPAPWHEPNVAVRLQLTDADGSAVSRIYTVRRLWQVGNQLTIEIDVVRHASPSPGMRWIEAVAAGDVLALTGPRPHVVPAVDGCVRSIWLTDASGLPAVHSLLAGWAATLPVHVIVAADDRAPVADLPRPDGVTVERIDPAPGALLATVRAMGVDAATGIWMAGERAEARAIRDWATGEAGVPAERVRAFGYWHTHRTATDLDARRILFYKERFDQGLGMAGVDDLEIPD